MATTPYIYFRGRRMTREARDAWLAAEQRCGWEIKPMTQGGWNAGGVAASAGTHDRDAADCSVRGKTKAQVTKEIESLRWAGWFASLRTASKRHWGVRPQYFSSIHVHAVPNGWGLVSAGARRQAEAYRRGRDGLRGNGPDAGGPGHVSTYRKRLTPMKPKVTVLPSPKPVDQPKRAVPLTDPVPRWDTRLPWMIIPVDGVMSGTAWSRLQWELRVKPTGALDHWTVRALKIWLGGLAADDGTGVLRVIDVQRLQARVGATHDGNWGPVTTRALQTWLNKYNPSNK